MLKDTFRAQSEEIVVDMFAGAGGASCGLEMADIHVHAAINHDPVAVSLHARNHPETEHHVQDVYTLSPQWVTRGRSLPTSTTRRTTMRISGGRTWILPCPR